MLRPLETTNITYWIQLKRHNLRSATTTFHISVAECSQSGDIVSTVVNTVIRNMMPMILHVKQAIPRAAYYLTDQPRRMKALVSNRMVVSCRQGSNTRKFGFERAEG